MLEFCKKVIKKTILYKPLRYIKNCLFKGPKNIKISIASQIESLSKYRQGPIKFSVLTSLYNTEKKYLIDMIESVIAQVYQNWEMIIVDSSDEKHLYVEKIIKKYLLRDCRIKYYKIKNFGISGNFNMASSKSTGDYLVFLDHDDVLSPIAIAVNAKYIIENGYDCLYSDETHVTSTGKNCMPLYKPDFSIDLLRCQNYICHLLVIKKKVFNQVGGFNKKYDGAQDYELILKISEITKSIFHIPRILYKWREHKDSTSLNPMSKEYAHDAGKRALVNHLKKLGIDSKVEDNDYMFCYDVRYKIPKNIKASIIIPMKDNLKMTKECITSILNKTDYKNFEILIMNNRSTEQKTLSWLKSISNKKTKVIDVDFKFNWAKINNIGATYASGDVLIFLNNDTQIISRDWLERLVENALRKDIGAVGGLLLYDNNLIQHAGVVVGMFGVADHVFKLSRPTHSFSPYISPVMNRNVLAVTGACLAVEKKKFFQVKGFDERFVVCGNDVEMCLRLHQNGYLNLYNAKVRLYHYESKTRSTYIPKSDFKLSENAYKKYLTYGDPYYNINLRLDSLTPKENFIYEY